MANTPKLRGALIGTSLLATLAAASPALASGFYIQEQSARGAGRAYSGEVADQGADSLWWNPAAIGGMTGSEGALNATAILPRADVQDTGTGLLYPGQTRPIAVGGNPLTHDPINNGVVPSGAIAHALTHNIAVGLALTAPYNFTTEYASDSWARYSALKTNLRTIDIQPSVAVMPVAGLSLGAAINIERTSAQLGNAVPNLSPLLPDGNELLKGSGWDVGYSLGAQYAAGPLSLGVSYKSSIRHHLDGSLAITGLLGPVASGNMSASTSASFATPWQLIFGGRLKVAKGVTLNAQATHSGWAKFDAIAIGAPVNAAIPEGYHNTWNYSVGIDAEVLPTWTLRTGIQRDLSPVPGNARDQRVPDSNRWMVAAGASHAFSKRFTMDAAINYVMLDSAPINRNTGFYLGTPAATYVLTSGQMTNASVLILSLGGRMKF